MDFLDQLSNNNKYTISFEATRGRQFGKQVITAQSKLIDIISVFEVDSSVQRELNTSQIASISQYILNKLQHENSPIFFPPFVFSARGHGQFIADRSVFELNLDNRIAVLDGQHRLEAFKNLETIYKNSEQPEEMAVYNKLIELPLTLQIYEGLNLEQEQQLFTDINAMNARVSANLIKYYDENNPTSILMRAIVCTHPSIAFEQFEVRKNTTQTKLMTGLTVYRLIALFHSGKVISNQVDYEFPKCDYEMLREKTILFLNLLVKYMPSPEAYDRSKLIYLNQSVILAMAKTTYSIKDTSKWECFFKKVIFTYDWSHSNKDLLNKRIPFNYERKRFRLTPESRVINVVHSILDERLNEVI